jgi:bacillithiol synthase
MFIPLESLSSSSTLVKDFAHSFDKVSRFFNGDYHQEQVYRRLLPTVAQAPRADRRILVERLMEQNKNFHCQQATMQNIELLAKPDSLAVVTGQQVGLFTGPLYTIYKALTTCKLAANLSRQLQHPVVPVFYLVTEDHDFDEVRWIGLWNQNHQYQKIRYTPAVMPQRVPMSEIILDESIYSVLQVLQTWTPDSEFKNDLLEQVSNCYGPGCHFVSAFARLFSHLLQDLGVILLDASDPQLKQLARPILQKELAEFTSVSAMMRTNEELLQNGYHTQLAVHPSRPHLFLLEHGRHSLEKEGDRLRNMHSNVTYSIAELLQQTERTSPKAALRPIVQDWLLPTIAYVGGPGEIAYFAQLKQVYADFGIPMPVVAPRAGFTLVEPKIQRHLDKFSLDSVDVI